MKKTISETAFLTNWCRSSDPKLSGDKWAHLWVTPAARRFGERYRERVSRHMERPICLRNRFFADALASFQKRHTPFTFINIAAGFSMYPYLLDPKNRSVEIDYPHVVEYKRSKLKRLERAGKVPKREVEFLPLALAMGRPLEKLAALIREAASRGAIFVLLEGVLYYLDRPLVDSIFDLLAEALPPKSMVGATSWATHLMEDRTIKALEDFFEEELGFPRQRYTWLDDDYFRTLNPLRLIEQASYAELEERCCRGSAGPASEGIIAETMSLLEKE